MLPRFHAPSSIFMFPFFLSNHVIKLDEIMLLTCQGQESQDNTPNNTFQCSGKVAQSLLDYIRETYPSLDCWKMIHQPVGTERFLMGKKTYSYSTNVFQTKILGKYYRHILLLSK